MTPAIAFVCQRRDSFPAVWHTTMIDLRSVLRSGLDCGRFDAAVGPSCAADFLKAGWACVFRVGLRRTAQTHGFYRRLTRHGDFVGAEAAKICELKGSKRHDGKDIIRA